MDATQTSGPAWMYMVPSDSRAAEEPSTLVIAKTLQPSARMRRAAVRVSAVSPDWVMMTQSVCSVTSGSL